MKLISSACPLFLVYPCLCFHHYFGSMFQALWNKHLPHISLNLPPLVLNLCPRVFNVSFPTPSCPPWTSIPLSTSPLSPGLHPLTWFHHHLPPCSCPIPPTLLYTPHLSSSSLSPDSASRAEMLPYPYFQQFTFVSYSPLPFNIHVLTVWWILTSSALLLFCTKTEGNLLLIRKQLSMHVMHVWPRYTRLNVANCPYSPWIPHSQ